MSALQIFPYPCSISSQTLTFHHFHKLTLSWSISLFTTERQPNKSLHIKMSLNIATLQFNNFGWYWCRDNLPIIRKYYQWHSSRDLLQWMWQHLQFLHFLAFKSTSGRSMDWEKKMYHGGFFFVEIGTWYCVD